MMANNRGLPSEHHIHEECGVFGVFSKRTADVASLAYYGLFALQHRGQEGAGIVVNDDGVFRACKDTGLVNEVFSPARMEALGKGNIVVGHVRYATTGSGSRANIQPLVINHHKGRMALAHNGNLTNSYALRTGSIEAAVSAAMDRLEGAYSLVVSSPTKLIAARDPHGFRPLCMGTRPDGAVVFASESCAWTRWARSLSGTSRRGKWSRWTPGASAVIPPTAARRPGAFACLNISTFPGRIPRWTAPASAWPDSRRGRSWQWSIRWRPMW